MVPAHLQVLSAHQSCFSLRVDAEGLGFQIDKHETQTETLQICPAEKPDSYNTDLAYDIGIRYRKIPIFHFYIVYDICKNYDMTYDIVSFQTKNGVHNLRYRCFCRCRIRYHRFCIRYRTFDVRYDVR